MGTSARLHFYVMNSISQDQESQSFRGSSVIRTESISTSPCRIMNAEQTMHFVVLMTNSLKP